MVKVRTHGTPNIEKVKQAVKEMMKGKIKNDEKKN